MLTAEPTEDTTAAPSSPIPATPTPKPKETNKRMARGGGGGGEPGHAELRGGAWVVEVGPWLMPEPAEEEPAGPTAPRRRTTAASRDREGRGGEPGAGGGAARVLQVLVEVAVAVLVDDLLLPLLVVRRWSRADGGPCGGSLQRRPVCPVALSLSPLSGGAAAFGTAVGARAAGARAARRRREQARGGNGRGSVSGPGAHVAG